MKIRLINHRQCGMTLIEVMIAVTISLVLLAGVMQIFLSTKQTYRMQDGISRIQENARFGLRILEQNIRMAGYSGCMNNNISVVNNVKTDGDDTVFDFNTGGLLGYDTITVPVNLFVHDPATGAMTTLDPSEVYADTDILVITHGSTDSVGLEGNLTSDNANIDVGAVNASKFSADDILFLSDCQGGDVFRATNASNNGTISHSSTGNKGPKLSKTYGEDAVIMKLEKTVYYIGTNANGIPALFRKRMLGQGGVTEELIEGVENLQLQYGEDIDDDGIPNRYVNADEIIDTTVTPNDFSKFANVAAVRIGLLMRSPEEIQLAQDTRTYQVLDTVVDPVDDGRTRRLFTSTVKIRNKGTK